MPPTGLVTVCAMLPPEFEVMPVADLNISPLTDAQIKEADIIFTSSMIVQNDSLEEVVERAHHFGKKVVAGGPHPTSYPEKVKADHLVMNEAETTLPQFLEDLKSGNLKRIYQSSSKPLITTTPIPRWDLLDLKNYSSLAIQYSRGCPFDCDFCDITALFGREPRTKNPEQMIREVDAIYQTGWRGSIFIVDDNFIGNKRNVRQMLPPLTAWQKKNKYPFTFFTEASMDLAANANEDIRNDMIDAGFDSVFLGIESPDPDVLNSMDKRQNAGGGTTPAEKVRILQKAGFEVTGGFIIGNDKEKPEIFENLFNFIQETGIVVPMAGLLTALKGTKLYNRLESEGRLTGESSGNNTHDLGFNFKTKLPEDFLIEGYMGLLKKLFEPKNYYERCRTLSANRGEYRRGPVNPHGINALVRLLYENVVQHPEPEFGRYLLETILTRPSEIPVVVTHAAKLRHFKTMTDSTADVKAYTQTTESLYEKFCQKAESLKGDAQRRLHALGDMEKEVLSQAKRKYNKIHEDFRDKADVALQGLRQRIADYKSRHTKK